MLGWCILGTTIGGLSLNTGCKSAPKTTPPSSVPDLSYNQNVDPATIDNQNLPSVTPLNGLHVSPESEPTPVFKISDYSLRVYGLVDNPLTLTLEEFQQFDQVTQDDTTHLPQHASGQPRVERRRPFPLCLMLLEYNQPPGV